MEGRRVRGRGRGSNASVSSVVEIPLIARGRVEACAPRSKRFDARDLSVLKKLLLVDDFGWGTCVVVRLRGSNGRVDASGIVLCSTLDTAGDEARRGGGKGLDGGEEKEL